ncbi:haloacid dehalogenase type II [Pantoea sp. 1.19]|uniref:haloacid dehalogenase type II n=1 Tax=Pantoea sp. 1.19 TaxID=1925589 RepID=UPI000948BCCD|nr:haloacid dehalogenase type II [Pantoea sp. 1.19]
MTERREVSETAGVLFFDVNETLLDTAPLKASVGKRLGGRADLADVWFTSLLHYSLVDSVTGCWHPFGDIAEAVLQMTAERYGVSLAAADRPLASVLATLPVHPDVPPGLALLRQRGYTLVALTNSSATLAQEQLRAAGIGHFFTAVLSVETLNTYKPALRVYHWAAQQMGSPVAACMMIAAHGWDIGGARLAGLKTAFIARPGQACYPLAPQPDLVASDITALAARLAP